MGSVVTERTQLQTADGLMDVIIARPVDEPRGGVVVVQEAFGLTGHIERVAQAVAEAGYLAVAPALFHRSTEQVFGYGDFDRLGPVIMALTAETIETDVDAALGELARHGIDDSRIGIMGFCMGGTITLATAARRRLGAAITFYGAGIAASRFGLPAGLDSATRLQTPWLGLYGDLDDHIPVDEVEQLRVAAATSAVDTEIVRYVDADHGFHCDERPSFQAEASADAWARTLQFLAEHIA